MNKNAFDSLSYFVKFRSKQAAEKSMSNATVRLRGTEQTTYVDIFVDGTWQRNCFSSKLRVLTSISIDSVNF